MARELNIVSVGETFVQVTMTGLSTTYQHPGRQFVVTVTKGGSYVSSGSTSLGPYEPSTDIVRVSGLQPGTSYTATGCVTNIQGSSDVCEVKTFTTESSSGGGGGDAPQTPGAPALRQRSATTLKFSTTAQAGVTYHWRLRPLGSSSWWTYYTLTNEIELGPLTPNTTYEIQVSLSNSYGQSGWSPSKEATTDALVLTAPTNFRVVSLNENAVGLAWNPVAGATYYEISINGAYLYGTSGNSMGITRQGWIQAATVCIRATGGGATGPNSCISVEPWITAVGPFTWDPAIVAGTPIPLHSSGRPAPLKASEWNRFTTHVNEVRTKVSGDQEPFQFGVAQVGGSNFVTLVNQAVRVINGLLVYRGRDNATYRLPNLSSGQPVTALVFNRLAERVNQVDSNSGW